MVQLLLVALLALQIPTGIQDPDTDTWLTDLDAATEQALADGRPLLIVFR